MITKSGGIIVNWDNVSAVYKCEYMDDAGIIVMLKCGEENRILVCDKAEADKILEELYEGIKPTERGELFAEALSKEMKGV